MTQANPVSETTLRISRTFAAPRELVFRAWTDPQSLQKWWRLNADYTPTITEVDLRVGGKYRLGMQTPDNDRPLVVGGIFREVRPPEKLVYTWVWENLGEQDDPNFTPAETLITVEFNDLGGRTEIVLTHEFFPNVDMRDQHSHGWSGCLDQLAALVEA
jgi:uncharacterized protein YndB with AHSA1/START domain